jgi:pentatricopeptide repeat protein
VLTSFLFLSYQLRLCVTLPTPVEDGRTEDTLQYLQQLMKSHIGITAALLTTLLVRAARLPHAEQLVATLFHAAKDIAERKPDLSTNVRLWSAVLYAMATIGNINEVLPMLRILSQRGLQLDSYAYNTVINGLAREQHMNAAQSTYDHMRNHSVPVDMRTYSSLIRGWTQKVCRLALIVFGIVSIVGIVVVVVCCVCVCMYVGLPSSFLVYVGIDVDATVAVSLLCLLTCIHLMHRVVFSPPLFSSVTTSARCVYSRM